MKCNQNCLKNAGNPRDMRRFQVGKEYKKDLLIIKNGYILKTKSVKPEAQTHYSLVNIRITILWSHIYYPIATTPIFY